MTTDWTIDELSHAGQEHLDAAFVDGYDRKQGLPDPAFDLDILAALGIGPDATVIDLGAGTGQFAIAGARRFARVVAVDVSSTMLRRLQERAATEGIHNIEVVEAGFLSYEPVGLPVDAIYTRNALHHLPDFWKALALQRMARWLRPGGVLRVRDLIYDATPSEVPAVIEAWVARAVDDPTRGYTRNDLLEHVRTEHSTFRWLFEATLAHAGFAVQSVEYRDRVYGAYTCLRSDVAIPSA